MRFSCQLSKFKDFSVSHRLQDKKYVHSKSEVKKSFFIFLWQDII